MKYPLATKKGVEPRTFRCIFGIKVNFFSQNEKGQIKIKVKLKLNLVYV